MARDADHVTMLQRSPGHITVLPGVDKTALRIRRLLPATLAHRLIRFKNAGVALGFYLYCRRFPTHARKTLRGLASRILPQGYDVNTHFNPSYDPWDQRLCVIPDADLFRSIKSGKAGVVTDHIDHFTSTGITLRSGAHLEADIVVTATGLQVLAFGGIELSVDGAAIDPNSKFLYRGRMLEEVPNSAWSLGYTNASWTLRADVTAKAVAKLLQYMDTHGYTHAYPDRGGKTLPEVPALDLQSGYIQRAAAVFPKSSTKRPWTFCQNVVLVNIDARRDMITESMKFGTSAAK